MKRIVCILLALGWLVGFPSAAAAQVFGENGFESLPLSPEFEEISSLEPQILQELNQIARGTYGEEIPALTPDDLHWEQAYKIYTDLDIYALGTDSAQEVLAALEQDEYGMWVVPAGEGERLMTVSLSIGHPVDEERVEDLLTQEEIDQLKEQVGHWTINSIAAGSPFQGPLEGVDYPGQVDALLESKGVSTDCEKIFLGGFVKMRSVVCVTIEGETMGQVVVFRTPWLMGQSGLFTPRSKRVSNIKEGAVLPFEQMSGIMEEMVFHDPAPVEPPSFAVLGVALGLFALVIAALALCRRKRGR